MRGGRAVQAMEPLGPKKVRGLVSLALPTSPQADGHQVEGRLEHKTRPVKRTRGVSWGSMGASSIVLCRAHAIKPGCF